MALEIAGIVGPQVQADGTVSRPRLGRAAELVVTELHGRYFEQAVRKNVFTANASLVATSLVGAAMVGLQVWNSSPLSGGVNLAILKVGGMIVATSATQTGVVLAVGTGQVGAPTSQTAVTRVQNNFIGGPGPQATALNAGTYTNAPITFMHLLHNTAAIATVGEDQGYNIDLEGIIIIPPQCYIAVAAAGAAGAASSNIHWIMWEEVPI